MVYLTFSDMFLIESTGDYLGSQPPARKLENAVRHGTSSESSNAADVDLTGMEYQNARMHESHNRVSGRLDNVLPLHTV